jgi:nitrate reductase (NAD(P)H)
VTRCEVTLDDGYTWQLAEMCVKKDNYRGLATDAVDREYPEDRYRQMRYEDDVYGVLDLTERDTCLYVCYSPS